LSDRMVLASAAEAGRLPRTLRSLSARHAQLAAAHFRLIAACAYPLGVLHLGILLRPILSMIDWDKGFQWNSLTYVGAVLSGLVPLWLLILGMVFLARRRPQTAAAIGRRIPLIAGYVRQQSLADFAFNLGNFVDAGVRIDHAWATAGAGSTAPDLRNAANAITSVIARGERPGAKLAAWPCFPADFVALYRTGEYTGQLEQNLLQLATQYQERANRTLTVATLVFPAIMFLIVAVTIAVQVLKAYAGYFKMIEKLGS
jgi:type II secretory pathway component PulF